MERAEIETLYQEYFPDEEIVNICRNIVWADGRWSKPWKYEIADLLNSDFINEYCEDEIPDALVSQRLLYSIVKKAKADAFPIEEWSLFEIPYGDKDGQVWSFVNTQEYYQYHTLGQKDVIIRSLDFYALYTGFVSPSSVENHVMVDKQTCSDAVYVI